MLETKYGAKVQVVAGRPWNKLTTTLQTSHYILSFGIMEKLVV